MIRTLLPATLCAMALAGVAQPAAAQDEFQLVPLQATLPESLLGVPCKERDLSGLGGEGARSLMCFPTQMLEQPSIGITMVVEREPSLGQMSENIRESFHESGILRVVREREFSPPGFPEIEGVHGIYETNLGVRRTWALWHDGVYIRVIVAVFSEEADGDYHDEIMKAVFGPERFVAPAEGESE